MDAAVMLHKQTGHPCFTNSDDKTQKRPVVALLKDSAPGTGHQRTFCATWLPTTAFPWRFAEFQALWTFQVISLGFRQGAITGL